MSFDEVRNAVLDVDPDAVVRAIAEWSEEQRKAALPQLLALEQELDDPAAWDLIRHQKYAAYRQALGDRTQKFGPRQSGLELFMVFRLLHYGLNHLKDFDDRFLPMVDHEPDRVVQVLKDRRPAWFSKWYADRLSSLDLSVRNWLDLHRADLAEWNAQDESLLPIFVQALPAAYYNDRATYDQAVSELPDIEQTIYRICDFGHHSSATYWAPIFKEWDAAGQIDRSRLLRSALRALHRDFGADHERNCIAMTEVIDPMISEWNVHQEELVSLLGHATPVVAGFAVGILSKLQTGKTLDAAAALPELPLLFQHKAKKHAKVAVDLITAIAADPQWRSAAVNAMVPAVSHPHADIQKAASKALTKHLQSEDADALKLLEDFLPGVVPSLRPDFQKLLTSHGGSPATAATSTVISDFDLAAYEQRLHEIDPATRALLNLDPLLAAAQHQRLDFCNSWPLMKGRVLDGVSRIEPISSMETLIDEVSAAVERLECPDQPDRILEGMVRLREKPADFDRRTAALAKQVTKKPDSRPRRGLIGCQYGRPFASVISSWLGNSDVVIGRNQIGAAVAAVRRILEDSPSTILLSAPTHRGGWIDPDMWMDRLEAAQGQGWDIDERDLIRSMLRLAPDGRAALLKRTTHLQPPLRDVANFVLGGDVDLAKVSGKPKVWVAACRARDPKMMIPQNAAFAKGLKGPDVLEPTQYSWNMRQQQPDRRADNIDVSFTGSTAPSMMQKIAAVKTDMVQRTMNPIRAIMRLMKLTEETFEGHGFVTAEVHSLEMEVNPDWTWPFLATNWPTHLDWYWCLASTCLVAKVNSKASVEEAHGQFLLPLLEHDRPITTMAARALWIATVSKDQSARGPAIDVWIALIEDARADVDILLSALHDVAAGGWLKHNRVADALDEVARVSPLHAWVCSEVVDRYVGSLETLPRDVAVLLASLLEWNTTLGLPISEQLAATLTSIHSGKAKQAAKQLTALRDCATADRQTALTLQLDAKFARAERFRESIG